MSFSQTSGSSNSQTRRSAATASLPHISQPNSNVYSQASAVGGTPSTAWLNKPLAPELSKLPVVTFVATLISLLLYGAILVMLIVFDCPWDKNQVGHLFVFCVYAMIASAAMLAINLVYSHYRYNCLSLSVSFLYSGSATLVLYIMISSTVFGLCQPEGTPDGSLFFSGRAGNWVIWFTGIGAASFQAVAHYYYG